MPTDWADYRTKYNTIAANHSTVTCFIALSKPSKWSAVLAQAMQQFKMWTWFFLPDFNYIFQWTNSKHDCHNLLWSVHLALMSIIRWFALNVVKIWVNHIQLLYCLFNNAVYTVPSDQLHSSIMAYTDLSLIVKSHRNYGSISISNNFIAYIEHTSKAKCVCKVYLKWIWRNSTTTLIEQSPNWVMSISKFAQCWLILVILRWQ